MRIAFALPFVLCAFFCHGNGIKNVAVNYQVIDEQTAKASVRYQLEGPTDSLTFDLLTFQKVNIESISVQVNGIDVPFELITHNETIIQGHIAHLSAHTNNELLIQYRVISTKPYEMVLPVVLLNATPPEVDSRAFQAEIKHPELIELEESFPNVEWTKEINNASFSMEVIPSVVRVRIVPKGEFSISPILLIDIGVIFLLVGLSYLGWRHLKSMLV